ncbi:queuine tRNA-ribosyltransferase [Edhazardia aedis USNM 41457]|uniref:Queuine tRNA-ribosyltransferase n=1 Tax=Edhazardia aedis (strain USNM 41457) TaxID=1003232 RepID=J9D2Z5_EDHAE|nr:queuine tRNA-ribosyltransferase [Edhazardia aedis USNM 41457]|eukprot:EJW01944.1 queuine tRNA-ribosyltransferase [Edhazardia aedis USNM 41457]
MKLGEFKIIAECPKTRARASIFKLHRGTVNLPTFMPVATKASMKGVLSSQFDHEIILANTYHCRNLNRNLDEFMSYYKPMLTDSGGFQIVSLKDAFVVEDGVIFPNLALDCSDECIARDSDTLINSETEQKCYISLDDNLVGKEIEQCSEIKNKKEKDSEIVESEKNTQNINYVNDTTKSITSSNKKTPKIDKILPHCDEFISQDTIKCEIEQLDKNYIIPPGSIMMSPEDSIKIQNILGADIIMQLDDVLNPLQPRDKIEVGMERSLRWLKRCLDAHKNQNQILFPIIQGGLHDDLRLRSIDGILKHKINGIAIGGLCGGENKEDFCKTVDFSIKNLPKELPKYVMGIGYPESVVLIIALGADMSDCVYPTRTARFGRAFTNYGDLCMLRTIYATDLRPIDIDCGCYTCLNYTRAYLFNIKFTTNFCSLMTVHNLFFMENLTKRARNAIIEGTFENFIISFFNNRYKDKIPQYVLDVFDGFSIDLRQQSKHKN